MRDSASAHSFQDMILSVFDGQDPGGIVWQPRLEYWYEVNRKRGTLPQALVGTSLMDVYDYCHASVRYFGSGLRVRHQNTVIEESKLGARQLCRRWVTPVGTLVEQSRLDAWGLSGYHTEYKLKGPNDFLILRYILQDEEWYWDEQISKQDLIRVGARGVPQFYFRRSPLQALMIDHMGYEAAIYALHDYPDTVREYLEVASAADDALYRVLCECPIAILNLGENIDAFLNPPPIWRRYQLPYYRRRTKQLRAAGKYVHIHIDGNLRPLLPELVDGPWDGIEAATPYPQGDVSLDEIRAIVGDGVLLDGIPAVYFLPWNRIETLVECVEHIIERFYPRLILGISDELPPDGELERVRFVGKLVESLL